MTTSASPRKLTVVGRAYEEVTPDRALVCVYVQTEMFDDEPSALHECRRQRDEVHVAVEQAHPDVQVTVGQLTTHNVHAHVKEHELWHEGGRTRSRWERIGVKGVAAIVVDVAAEATSGVLATVGDQPASYKVEHEFWVSPQVQRTTRDRIQSEATRDALRRANILASAAGGSTVQIVEINPDEPSTSRPQRPHRRYDSYVLYDRASSSEPEDLTPEPVTHSCVVEVVAQWADAHGHALPASQPVTLDLTGDAAKEHMPDRALVWVTTWTDLCETAMQARHECLQQRRQVRALLSELNTDVKIRDNEITTDERGEWLEETSPDGLRDERTWEVRGHIGNVEVNIEVPAEDASRCVDALMDVPRCEVQYELFASHELRAHIRDEGDQDAIVDLQRRAQMLASAAGCRVAGLLKLADAGTWGRGDFAHLSGRRLKYSRALGLLTPSPRDYKSTVTGVFELTRSD